MARFHHRYEPPVPPQPLKDRVSIDDPESVGTVYQILCDAAFQSGDSVGFRGVSLELSSLAKDNDDETVYRVRLNGESTSVLDFLILDHQNETATWRSREFLIGEDEIIESDVDLSSDIYVRKKLEQDLLCDKPD